MYIVNVNNFRPFDLFILLNAAFRNSNIAFSHAALDICLRCAYNALKQTVRQCPSGSYGDAEAAAGYNYKAYFVIPLFICVDGGPQVFLRPAVNTHDKRNHEICFIIVSSRRFCVSI